MIVKDEAHVLGRCLASVRDFLSYWTICDTGSTDDTERVAREALAGIPGQFVRRPWVDFAHNRNESLELARDKADYTFVIDADDVVQREAGHETLPPLTREAYTLLVDQGGLVHKRIHFVKNTLPWRYKGVLHECLVLDQPYRSPLIPGWTYRWLGDGARSKDPAKYLRDVEVLKRALETEPDNRRYWFFLGQSYLSADRPEDALVAHRKRAEMGGHGEEAFLSKLQVAHLLARLGHPDGDVRDAFLAAYAARPHRAEPLCSLASFYKKRGDAPLAYVYATAAAAIPMPRNEALFVDDGVYAWKALNIQAWALFRLDRFAEAIEANERLLKVRGGVKGETARITANLDACRRALEKKPASAR